MSVKNYLACDLGAESGRVMLGTLSDGKITLKEYHRFPSAVVTIGGSLRWNILQIFEEIRVGLRAAAKEGLPISAVSTDSWGVDYVLIKEGEPCLTIPFHYRDGRTDDGFARVFAKVAKDAIFESTGIQFMPFNTIFQLNDDAEKRADILGLSDGFLNIADYLNYLMSGVARAEESLASTTQLYNPRTKTWAWDLVSAIGLKDSLFPKVVPSGTVLGPLLPELAQSTGLSGVQVVATCSHDTGAAIAAVPAEGEDWAYLSSGTWSLLGVECSQPIINEKSRALNFTNEMGYGGTTRFLKNIIGLWIIQECRRTWAAEGQEFDYGTLTRLAAGAPALRSLIFPDAPQFSKPGGMPEKIAAYCRASGQPVPASPGEFVRCAIDSLALLYRKTLEELISATGTPINRLHIVGGGSRNGVLNQAAADATGRTVLAGPVEATALGNVLIQALALGHLSSVSELRSIVKYSFESEIYTPSQAPEWEQAFQRFEKLPQE
ncbi:MAG: rhamnulokinase family protein [Terrimicrobiaceae bacterium]